MSKINVLWVEDQVKSEACQAFCNLAEDEGIKLIIKGNWHAGKEYLLSHKEEISAIILDCYCKLTSDGVETDEFLREVIPEIDKISSPGKLFPWYVLSADLVTVLTVLSDTALQTSENFGIRIGKKLRTVK